VPTALERQGNFSQSIDNNRNPIKEIDDPITRQPYPNRTIPVTKIYGPGQALLNLYPLPNIAQTQNYNYTSQVPGKIPRRSLT